MKLKINSYLYYSDAVLWDIVMATVFNLSILHTVKWSNDVQSLYPNFWHVGSCNSHFFLPPADKLFKFMHMFLSCNINSLKPSSLSLILYSVLQLYYANTSCFFTIFGVMHYKPDQILISTGRLIGYTIYLLQLCVLDLSSIQQRQF